MFVHVLERERKKKITEKNPGRCVSGKCSEQIDKGLLFSAALNQTRPRTGSLPRAVLGAFLLCVSGVHLSAVSASERCTGLSLLVSPHL